MYSGRVCIAGYDINRSCIRPVPTHGGIPEPSLYKDGTPFIYPFAVVSYDLLESTPSPPHTEDYVYDLRYPKFVSNAKEREAVLCWSLYNSIGDIFEQPIYSDHGFYVMDCQGPRSLGTIRPVRIIEVMYKPDQENTWDYRMSFLDNRRVFYRLKINDLTWHYFCNSLRGENNDPTTIASKLTKELLSKKVYLRIGLARGWNKFPDRCYLQITGVYTFPDYLDGRNFSDFAPSRTKRQA